jgi:hypothetical protein
MNTRRVFALAVIFVLGMGLAGPGCVADQPCSDVENNLTYIDNRDRHLPEYDADWICINIKHDDTPPPTPPDVSGVSPPDPPGPRDPEAVVKAAIMLNSCLGIYGYEPYINRSISTIYYDLPREITLREMYRRTACFKDKTNGCEALRECLGVVEWVGEPPAEEGCAAGVHRYVRQPYSDPRIILNSWYNCERLGLHCYDDYIFDSCSPPRTSCVPDDNAPGCLDGRPYGCRDFSYFEDAPTTTAYYYYERPLCSDYGLECPAEEFPAFPDCRATGPACEDTIGDADLAVFTYRMGIACENETIMRACIGGGEKLVDCSTLALGFKCIPGDQPHCGFASECDRPDTVTCDGDSLVVCDGGRKLKVDCKSLGFTSCNSKLGVCSPGIYDQIPEP